MNQTNRMQWFKETGAKLTLEYLIDPNKILKDNEIKYDKNSKTYWIWSSDLNDWVRTGPP